MGTVAAVIAENGDVSFQKTAAGIKKEYFDSACRSRLRTLEDVIVTEGGKATAYMQSRRSGDGAEAALLAPMEAPSAGRSQVFAEKRYHFLYSNLTNSLNRTFR